MTNREWLNNIAMIDALMYLRKHGSCFISDKPCEIYGDYDNCYRCIARWLNEEKIESR